MIVNRFDAPGYGEAVKRETDIRDAAFLNLPVDICGIKIRQMTARDYLIIDGVGSPLLSAATPSGDDVLRFLWLMSTDKPESYWGWWRFKRKHRRLNFPKAFFLIKRYLSETFQDAPRGGSSNATRAGIAGWCAYLVDALASEYGWSLNDCINIPLKVLYQQVRCALHRHDPKKFIPNPSDEVTRQHLQLKNERLALLRLLKARAGQG